MMKVVRLTINPDSTSMKIGVFENEKEFFHLPLNISVHSWRHFKPYHRFSCCLHWGTTVVKR